MILESTQEHDSEFVDKETGEITVLRSTKSKTFITRVTGDNYYMTFLEALAPSLDLKMGELRLMVMLNTLANFNTGTFALTTKVRDEMCEMLNVKKQSLSNALNKLRSKKLLSYDRGEWQINPQYFWKGELSVRNQKLKDRNIRITFSIEDVEVKND